MVDDYKILNDKDFDMSVTGKNSGFFEEIHN